MKKLNKQFFIGAIVALFFMRIIPRKGVTDMVDMYVGLVIAHRRTCNPENKKVRLVPKIWRDEVLADLTALGYDADGNRLETSVAEA